ncbi:MAG: hypothetical protein AAGB12_05950 [Pseudomonadota bacterium]
MMTPKAIKRYLIDELSEIHENLKNDASDDSPSGIENTLESELLLALPNESEVTGFNDMIPTLTESSNLDFQEGALETLALETSAKKIGSTESEPTSQVINVDTTAKSADKILDSFLSHIQGTCDHKLELVLRKNIDVLRDDLIADLSQPDPKRKNA